MGRRSDFGSNWVAVVTDWGLGLAPPVTEDVGWAALDALERLYPNALARVLSNGARGSLVLAPLIELGRVLLACEQLEGFGSVLARLTTERRDRHDQAAAAAELRFAGSLVDLGYRPRLEPVSGTRKPDGVVTVGGDDVYYEVIAPAMPKAQRDALRALQEPLDVLLKTGRRRQERSGDINVIRGDLERLMQPVTIHFETSNERGVGLFEAEAKHFSKDTMNMVVIDVSAAMPLGAGPWVPFIQRRFHPGLNRTFGAVVLLQFSAHEHLTVTHCTVVDNPHAYSPLPRGLLADLRGLDRRAVLGTNA